MILSHTLSPNYKCPFIKNHREFQATYFSAWLSAAGKPFPGSTRKYRTDVVSMARHMATKRRYLWECFHVLVSVSYLAVGVLAKERAPHPPPPPQGPRKTSSGHNNNWDWADIIIIRVYCIAIPLERDLLASSRKTFRIKSLFETATGEGREGHFLLAQFASQSCCQFCWKRLPANFAAT